MLDTVREINEKRRSSVIVMESGDTFWLTWTQLQEHEPFAVGQEVDTDALREWLLPRQYPMALNDAVALLAQRAQASGEIRQKLKRKLYMEDTIEMVLYKLEKEMYVIERIERLKYDLQWLERMSPYEAINYIRHGIGYDEYVLEYAGYRKMRPEELYEILDELQEMSSEYKNYDDWFKHIVEYGEELKKQNAEKVNVKEGIELSTMHSSKGLEYKVVIILGANEGITPYRKAMLKDDIEEERRLFYVAMTRAKERLHILSVRERYGKEAEISRFVREINAIKKQ